MREMLTDNLEFEGYRVTSVESGEEALREWQGHAFSLLILDLMLPGMSGFDVCRELRCTRVTHADHHPDRSAGAGSRAQPRGRCR